MLKNQGTANFNEILEVFDMQLAALGTALHKRRRELIEELAPLAAQAYLKLSEDREQVELTYRSELNETPMDELLRLTRTKDLVNQFTTGGVHRDDIRMSIGGYPLRKYGSRDNKIFPRRAETRAVRHRRRTLRPPSPSCLLDDIFDKLDMQRVEQLIGIVSDDASDRFSSPTATRCGSKAS
ncbi:MAG: hypothetical protein ACLR8Y_01440 [Alistipes indistinctus]